MHRGAVAKDRRRLPSLIEIVLALPTRVVRLLTGLRHDGLVATLLPVRVTEVLRAARFTYEPVGATAGSPPSGYHHFTRTRLLKHPSFNEAGQRLLAWHAHERAGLRVAASSLRAEPGAVVVMRLGVGPVSVRVPCRVVYVVEEPDRIGFAYGTSPGHPESSEELFLVERDDLGHVRFTVTAFSKPATLLARVGGPVTRWAQHRMTTRYLDALDHR